MPRPPSCSSAVCLIILLTMPGSVTATGPEVSCNPSLFLASQDADDTGGPHAIMCAAEPWTADVHRRTLSAGRHTVRVFDDTVYVVHRATGLIELFDAASGEPLEQFSLGEDSRPHDILLVDASTAFITRETATHLLRLDLKSGEMTDVADLSIFADDDGIPDLAMMAREGHQLFIQVQRRNADEPMGFLAPGLIAVFDVSTETLIDADPVQPGVQAIELQGPLPQHKMQIDPVLRRLYVTATGELLTGSGGIEIVDLDSLKAVDFALAARDVSAHIGAFVIISAERGYFISHTDFALSSHLLGFTIGEGPDPTAEIVVTLGWLATALEHDPVTGLVFYPEGNSRSSGVHVIEAASGELLTTMPVDVGGRPTDLALVQRCPADLNANGSVDFVDLVSLLAAWGDAGSFAPTDFDHDGFVGFADLLILLSSWGPCFG